MWWITTVLAGDNLDKAAYEMRFSLMDSSHPDYRQVEACLRSWGSHPFATPESQRFRVVDASVRVMGFGSTEVVDDVATNYPQMVVIRPNVSVLTRTTWKLHNPNGWYCFDTSVAVLAKGEIELTCGAHLADGHRAVELLGNTDKGGVSVLGDVEVHREKCAK